MLIDDFLPGYHATERHEILIEAPPERVYAAVREMDLSGSRLIRGLFLLRGLPALLTGRSREGSPLGVTLEGLLRSGFVLLGERPGEELLLGLVGRFWTVTGDLQRLDADGFRRFERHGFAKAAWNFHLAPAAEGKTRLSTETRVLCTDEESRRRFRRYWLLIRPFSGLIRRIMLREIRRSAETA
jgi:hypothetical protein